MKVLYRNTNRIGEHGGDREVLHAVQPACHAPGKTAATTLRPPWGQRSELAERTFAAIAQTLADAFNDLLYTVQDETEVHRTVLPYRSWDMLGLIGEEYAHTLLRQSVRYCVNGSRAANKQGAGQSARRAQALGSHAGHRQAEDNWIDNLSQTIFNSTPAQAADAAAAALAEGFSPAAIGEAIAWRPIN